MYHHHQNQCSMHNSFSFFIQSRPTLEHVTTSYYKCGKDFHRSISTWHPSEWFLQINKISNIHCWVITIQKLLENKIHLEVESCCVVVHFSDNRYTCDMEMLSLTIVIQVSCITCPVSEHGRIFTDCSYRNSKVIGLKNIIFEPLWMNQPV